MAVFFFLIMALSILSLNCNGIRDQSKRNGHLQWLRFLPVSVDIVCLQDTHSVSVAECSLWFQSSGFGSAVSCGSSHSCGCIVLFRPSLTRFLQCEFSLFTKLFRVCCIYGPNRNPAWDLFLDGLHHRINPLIPTVLAGDFNTVFDCGLDQSGSDPSDSSHESSSSLLNLFDSCCVLDIWRYLHPTVSGFTWTRWNDAFASRIDLFGVPYVWVPSVSSCDIIPCPFSDHCSVLLSVVVPDVIPPGPGLWKLNTSILEDGEYVRLISDLWVSWRASIPRFPSLAKWWEKGKSLIKGATIRYCCDRSVIRSKNRDLVVRLAAHLKARIDAGSVSCLAPYHGVLSQLAKIDLDTARGAQVRSRIKWVEEGNPPLRIFSALRRRMPPIVGFLR